MPSDVLSKDEYFAADDEVVVLQPHFAVVDISFGGIEDFSLEADSAVVKTVKDIEPAGVGISDHPFSSGFRSINRIGHLSVVVIGPDNAAVIDSLMFIDSEYALRFPIVVEAFPKPADVCRREEEEGEEREQKKESFH
jgi:hypothetical protein